MNRLLLLLLVIFIFAVGCGKPPGKKALPEKITLPEKNSAPSPCYGDTLVNSYVADIIALNPLITNDGVSFQFYDLLFNGLLKYDENYNLVPDLAETWEISADGLAITFKLRKDVLWHDGVSFTSTDVLFTFEKMIDPATGCPSRDNYTSFSTLEIPDDYTVRFRLKELFAPALEYCGFYVIPRHIYQNENIKTSKYNLNPVGTGAFKFTQWLPAEQIVLDANQKFYDGRPYFNKYICRIIPDSSMTFLSFKRGDIDCISLTKDQYSKQVDESFRAKYNLYKISKAYVYMPYNVQKPFLSELPVRKALGMAIDREELIKDVLHGFGKLISGPFTPGSWPDNPEVLPQPFDPTGAVELLKSAGFTDSDGDEYLERDGKKLSVRITNFGQDAASLVLPNLIRDFWKKIGVASELVCMNWDALMNDVNSGKFDAVLFGGSYGGWDPDGIYGSWHSSQFPDPTGTGSGFNYNRFSNSEMDSLLEQGRRTYDHEARRKIYYRIHALLNEQQPCTYIYSVDQIYAVDKRIYGISVTPVSELNSILHWYVPEGLQKYQ
ncbi:MAG: peptide-binding protein [Candidatus Wallbacteria bacterium]|nr:peptide-binding protein [Candidatus Wallbacteria bacterium]